MCNTTNLQENSDPPSTEPTYKNTHPLWSSQDICLRRGCSSRINHPFILPAHLHRPPWGNTIARLLGSIRLPFRPPVFMLYTIEYW